MSKIVRITLATAWLLGCANQHGMLQVEKIPVKERNLVRTSYDAELAGTLLDEGQEMRISAHEVTRRFVILKSYDVRTVVQEYVYRNSTPYQGARELVEVPSGLVSVPLSFGLHVLRIATLFFIPGDIVSQYTSWTFSALNPALNVEDSMRATRSLVARNRIEITESVAEREIDREPLSEVDVEVSLVVIDKQGNAQSGVAARRVQPTSTGLVSLDLLDLLPDALPGRPVAVEFRVLTEDGSLPIRRELNTELSDRMYFNHAAIVQVRLGMDGVEVAHALNDLWAAGLRDLARDRIEQVRQRLSDVQLELMDQLLVSDLQASHRQPSVGTGPGDPR